MEECVFLQTTDMLKLLHYLYVATLHSFNTNFPFHFGTCLGIPSAVATNMAGKCTDLRKYELWKVCSMSMSCASLLSERSRLLRINSECLFVLLFFLNIIHLIFFFHSSHAEVLCQKISLCALCHTFMHKCGSTWELRIDYISWQELQLCYFQILPTKPNKCKKKKKSFQSWPACFT